jgi:type II secretory ATPase GspE/PulE/Tfp pilus assembly ATPase PilB-like protein
MPVDHDMQNAILSQTSSASLQDLAISKGMSPLSHQAKNLLIAGETSLGEIQPYLVEQGDGLFLRGAFL